MSLNCFHFLDFGCPGIVMFITSSVGVYAAHTKLVAVLLAVQKTLCYNLFFLHSKKNTTKLYHAFFSQIALTFFAIVCLQNSVFSFMCSMILFGFAFSAFNMSAEDLRGTNVRNLARAPPSPVNRITRLSTPKCSPLLPAGCWLALNSNHSYSPH